MMQREFLCKRYFRAFGPGDDFQDLLIDMHHDLSDEQSALANARLVLLLPSHIGDISVLRETMKIAREGVGAAGSRRAPSASALRITPLGE